MLKETDTIYRIIVTDNFVRGYDFPELKLI